VKLIIDFLILYWRNVEQIDERFSFVWSRRKPGGMKVGGGGKEYFLPGPQILIHPKQRGNLVEIVEGG
jgi:hypothetical protein